MKYFQKLGFYLATACLVAACGGGGGSGNESSIVTPSTVSSGGGGPYFSFAISNAVAAKTTAEWQEYATLQAVAALRPLNNLDTLIDFNIPVVVDVCGRVNAFYDPRSRSITLCDELYDELLSQSSDNNTTATHVMNYILYHEIGHALVDILNLPVIGNAESAADFFASVIAGESGRSRAAVLGGLFLSAESTSYGDEHVGGEDRGGDIICLAIGSDSSLLFNSGLTELVDPFIDANRDCIAEYETQVVAIHQLIPSTVAINDEDIVNPEMLALTDPNPPKNRDQLADVSDADSDTVLLITNNPDEYWFCTIDGVTTSAVGYVFRDNSTGTYVRAEEGKDTSRVGFIWGSPTSNQIRLLYNGLVETLSDISFSGSLRLNMVSDSDGNLNCERSSLAD